MKEVLIVDNKTKCRALLNMHLDSAGFKAHEAGDVIDALVLLDDQPDIDIIILDITLPEQDGYWMLEALQEHTPYLMAKHRVIVTGNCTAPTFYNEAERRNIDTRFVLEFFEKPVYYEGIVWEIEALLERELIWFRK